MSRDQLLVITVAVCIVNGIFSHSLPLFFFANFPAWYPGFLPPSPQMVSYFSSLAAATTTLIVSGIPAALFERFTRKTESSRLSMTIWLVTAVALSYEAVDRFVTIVFSRG